MPSSKSTCSLLPSTSTTSPLPNLEWLTSASFSNVSAEAYAANPLSIAVGHARASGRQLFDLTESNPTRAEIFDAAPLVAELGHPRGTLYEPAPLGHADARRAVSAYYGSRGLEVDPERVVLSA